MFICSFFLFYRLGKLGLITSLVLLHRIIERTVFLIVLGWRKYISMMSVSIMSFLPIPVLVDQFSFQDVTLGLFIQQVSAPFENPTFLDWILHHPLQIVCNVILFDLLLYKIALNLLHKWMFELSPIVSEFFIKKMGFKSLSIPFLGSNNNLSPKVLVFILWNLRAGCLLMVVSKFQVFMFKHIYLRRVMIDY